MASPCLQLQLANSENIAIVHGVTDGSADTSLSTPPANPFGHTEVMCIPIGEGVYIEDDGSKAPLISGVTASTIDIKSTLTSKYYVIIVINLGPGHCHTIDHSGTTT